jgi:hypothetical protein
LRIAAQFANATVTRVRRHHPPMRALRGNFAAERFTLFALGHRETCKTTHGTEYRNSEEYLDHVPTSIAGRLCLELPRTWQICGIKARCNTSRLW